MFVRTNLNCIWLYVAQSLKFTSIVERFSFRLYRSICQSFEMLETVAMFQSRPISKHQVRNSSNGRRKISSWQGIDLASLTGSPWFESNSSLRSFETLITSRRTFWYITAAVLCFTRRFSYTELIGHLQYLSCSKRNLNFFVS